MLSTRYQRGQAVLETILFMPLFLVVLLASIFITQVGIASVRVQSAVRYGAQSAYPQNTYTIEQMYNYYIVGTNPEVTDPGCLPSQQSTVAALYQQEQPASAPTAFPVAPAFFQPTTVTQQCSPNIYSYNRGGNQMTAYGFGTIISNSVTANLAVPPYLKKISGTNFAVSANMNSINAVGPTGVLFCRPQIALQVAYVLSGNPNTGYKGWTMPNNGQAPNGC